MEIFKSQKGSDKIGFGGYIYRKNKTNITTQSWRCERKDCSGTASSAAAYVAGGTVVERQSHNHAPDPAKIEVARRLDGMLTDAMGSSNPPRRIVSNTVEGMSAEATAIAPKRKALTSRIQRKRKKLEAGEVEPHDRRNLVVPQKYTVVNDGGRNERFLLYDSSNQNEDEESDDDEDDNSNRMIVFVTDKMLDLLETAQTWMMDGTFKVTPLMFFQLYTIHALLGTHVFPCVYALLSNKETQSYERLLRVLLRFRPRMAPIRVVMDYELAMKRAVTAVFPSINVEGCFFHLSQSVWRAVQRFGLVQDYERNEEIRAIVKSLCALSFVQAELVHEAFESISNTVEERYPALQELLNYFEDTYLGRPGRRRRGRALFPVTMWSVRERTEEGLPRTTNKLEGWHRGIQKMFDVDHPSIFRFLHAICKEQGLQAFDFQQFQSGRDVQKTERKYKEANTALKNLIGRHNANEISTEHLLRAVSYHIAI